MKIFKKVLLLLITVCFSVGIYLLINYTLQFVDMSFVLDEDKASIRYISAAVAILTGLLVLGITYNVFERIAKSFNKLLRKFAVMPIQDIIGMALGLITGLIIAGLISSAVKEIPYAGSYISMVLYFFFGLLGLKVGYGKKDELFNLSLNQQKTIREKTKELEKTDKDAKKVLLAPSISPKILDTSVIIDGRINDVCKTGFIEGDLIVPNFVLDELQHIADSSDSLKRNRGRRGLDILNCLRSEQEKRVIINSTDYPDMQEVDGKLVCLAKDLNGTIITNDFNLNKVAQLHGVNVLNINDLSNALKPVVLPNEEMTITVIKEGKEGGQGLAYLDDGTMIVVENGRRHIGSTINVVVTSVLQTSAGKMIFVKPA